MKCLGLRLEPLAARLYKHGPWFPMGGPLRHKVRKATALSELPHAGILSHINSSNHSTVRNYCPWFTVAETKSKRNAVVCLRSQSHDDLNFLVSLPLSTCITDYIDQDLFFSQILCSCLQTLR